MRTARVIIHPTALAHNLAQVKSRTSSKVLAMVKADAYGHGVAACLPALVQADGFGVACFAEAIQVQDALKQAKIAWQKPIVLIEGVFSLAEWQQAQDQGFSCVIHQEEQVLWALQHRSDPKRLQGFGGLIWLKFNSGMNRLGFDEVAILQHAKSLTQAGYRLILTSHFANADEIDHPLNQVQGERFAYLLATLRETVDPRILGSLCNSAGVVNFAPWHFDWVRPGIMLYGSSPVQNQTATDLNLRSAMTLQAKIMAIQPVKQGQNVGYGSLWQAPIDSRLALISMGYGDGYPRGIDAHAQVAVLSKDRVILCPIRGRVAMDMMVIDLTCAPVDLEVGDTVILWGEALPIDTIAQHAQTISYELMCRLTQRPTRSIQ